MRTEPRFGPPKFQSREVLRLFVVCASLALSGCGQQTASDAGEPTPDSPISQQSSPGEQAPAAKAQDLEYGTLVDFTQGGNSDPLKVSGWNKAETGFTWTQGTVATIAARVRPIDSPIALRLKAAGMIKEPELPFQPVEVYVNNEKVADLQIGNTSEFSVAIPQGMTKSGGLLTVTFRTPKAASPKSMGQNEDERILGIRVYNVEFGPSA